MLLDGDPIEACLREIEQACRRIKRIKARQIAGADDRDYFKSIAYAWFRSHRPLLVRKASQEMLEPIDSAFRSVIDATARASAKSTYVRALGDAKSALTEVRAASLVLPSQRSSDADTPPNFGALASDAVMNAILERRWRECQACIRAGAPLAATVMMGGLLEALFVARANVMRDKAPLFRARATPVDPKTKKPIPLTDWTLRPYIDVGAELGWISRSGKDIAAVLRDYRNYIHPEKERSHGVELNGNDASMFWEVTKSLARQLLASVSMP